MSLVCITCAMRAMLADQPQPIFDETPEQHMAREHPDPEFNQLERQNLVKKLEAKIKQ